MRNQPSRLRIHAPFPKKVSLFGLMRRFFVPACNGEIASARSVGQYCAQRTGEAGLVLTDASTARW
jgi:hypothetical protein